MDRELSPEDAKELIALCQAGRQFTVEQWIRTGRSLQVPAELKKTPLGIAVAIGFRSLVELLLRHEETECAESTWRDARIASELRFQWDGTNVPYARHPPWGGQSRWSEAIFKRARHETHHRK